MTSNVVQLPEREPPARQRFTLTPDGTIYDTSAGGCVPVEWLVDWGNDIMRVSDEARAALSTVEPELVRIARIARDSERSTAMSNADALLFLAGFASGVSVVTFITAVFG